MAKGARRPAEARKLSNMISDLYAIKAELLPDEANKDGADLGPGADDFSKKKHSLNAVLSRLRNDIQRLNDMRAKLGKDERDTATIRLSSDNNTNLQDAINKLNDLKTQVAKDEKPRLGRKKLSEEQIADRRHILYLLAEDLKELTSQNAAGGSSSSAGHLHMSDDDKLIAQRVERQRARDDERKTAREAKRAARKGRKSGKQTTDEFDDAIASSGGSGPQSEQEQVFEQKVAENNAQQDEMLQQIGAAVDELKELAQDMNKHLTIQKAMLEQVDEKMDTNIQHFKTANQRMKVLLEESGGMARWCPMMICAIVLLALAGVIFKVI